MNLKTTGIVCILAVAGGIASGCEDGDKGATTGTFCDALSSERCTWLRSCCEIDQAMGVLGLDPGDAYSIEITRKALKDQGKCYDLLHADCQARYQEILASTDAGRITLIQARFDDCLESFGLAAKSCDIGLGEGSRIGEVCSEEYLFVGQQDNGQPCYTPLDCRWGTACWADGSGPGFCTATKGDGRPCLGNDECEEKICVRAEGETQWCVDTPAQGEGGWCYDDAHCGAGSFCDGANNQCMEKLDGYEDCGMDDQCKSGVCDPETDECLSQKPAGETCNGDPECESGLWCDTAYASSVCLLPQTEGGVGDPCDGSFIAPCTLGLVCAEGVCEYPKGVGEACSASDECDEYSYCRMLSETGGTCFSPRLGSGQSCAASRECLPQYYCDGMEQKCLLRSELGSSCVYGEDSCAVGTYCKESTLRCAPLEAEGAPCKSDGMCSLGLYCQETKGECQPSSAEGQPCELMEECAADTFCNAEEQFSSCQQTAEVGLGGTCDPPESTCGGGLYCEEEMCVALKGGGAECLDDGECQVELACLDDGLCGSRLPEGSPCSDGDCQPGLYCDTSATMTCVAFSGPGETCAADSQCEEGLICDGALCSEKHAAGETCEENDDCGEDLFCSTGLICALRSAVGQPCIPGMDMCEPGTHCSENTETCAALMGENELCLNDEWCEDGTYCRTYTGRCRDAVGVQGECSSTEQCSGGMVCSEARTCRRPAKLGENCDAEVTCMAGLRCDEEWGTCVYEETGIANGAPCHTNEECSSGICSGYICQGGCIGSP